MKSKFYIPRLRQTLVRRPRLLNHLHIAVQRLFTLVSAPAGFGKTTLLTEWATRAPQPVVWFSLDSGDNPQDPSDQPAQVNIGVDEDFSAEDGPVTYILTEHFNAAGREHESITVHNKYYDPAAAPKGKSAITVFLDSDYLWWKEVAADPARYQAEKDRCAKLVIDVVEHSHPGFRDRIEVVDVSTPLTRERYTGNWMGAMQARKPNANMIRALLQGAPRYTFTGVEGLYMAGQWVEAWGGITTAAQSGRKAIQAMCKHDGKRFSAVRA